MKIVPKRIKKKCRNICKAKSTRIARWASYQLCLASPSYDAPSVQLNERGNPIITKKEKNYGRQYFER